MVKKDLKNEIIKRLNIDVHKKIILFRNPNEFTYLFVENVNPSHKSIIWGKRHKKFNKGTCFIRVGKIFSFCFPFIFSFFVFDLFVFFVLFVSNVLFKISFFSLFFSCVAFCLLFFLPIVFEWFNDKNFVFEGVTV